jgi:hypothetical protein
VAVSYDHDGSCKEGVCGVYHIGCALCCAIYIVCSSLIVASLLILAARRLQGSITGAYCSWSAKDVVPSFILLAVQESKVVCYVYELKNDQVDVSKTEFTKKQPETANPALLQSLLS